MSKHLGWGMDQIEGTDAFAALADIVVALEQLEQTAASPDAELAERLCAEQQARGGRRVLAAVERALRPRR